MKTYLLTWQKDSKTERQESEFKNIATQLALGKNIEEIDWSTGNRNHMEVGSQVFFLRQGKIFPGIFGFGRVTEKPFLDDHWNPAKRKRRLKAWYVMVEVKEMIFPFPEGVLPRELIIAKNLLHGLEDARSSGVEVPPDLVANLERQWRAHVNRPVKNATPAIRGHSALEGERIEQRSYRRKRDIRLKEIALEFSGGVCAVCDTNYSKVLGGKGKRVLQVHHKRQLSGGANFFL